MSNTLPRTRSMSAASSTSLSSVPRERGRPVSMCDTSWHKVTATDMRATMMQRSPSQANNLSTTVPTSLVTRNLGGRHTPTRSSLRHSRMVVHGKGNTRFAANGRIARDRRWMGGVGRVGVLVITTQALVGVMTVTLAVWLLIWTPSMRFTEVPHYAGVPVLLSGVCGAILISCCDKRRLRTPATVFKAVVAVLCCISIVTCISVCVFTAMHLITLAPMICRTHHNVITQAAPSSQQMQEHTTLPPLNKPPGNDLRGTRERERLDKQKMINYDKEGSGDYPSDLEVDAEYNDYNVDLELEPSILQTVPARISEEISMNVSTCVCQSWDEINSWARTLTYPDLSCLEVNNILPVLFVASCVLTTVGAILSATLLYLLWSSRSNIYSSAKPSEIRPFIFTSKFKKTPAISNGSGADTIKNGDALYR